MDGNYLKWVCNKFPILNGFEPMYLWDIYCIDCIVLIICNTGKNDYEMIMFSIKIRFCAKKRRRKENEINLP